MNEKMRELNNLIDRLNNEYTISDNEFMWEVAEFQVDERLEQIVNDLRSMLIDIELFNS